MDIVRLVTAIMVLVFAASFASCDGMAEKHRLEEMFDDARVAELAKAVVDEDLDRIETLVSTGVPVNSVDRKNRTLLHYAVNWDRKASFRKLLSLGADPNVVARSDHTTILHWVAVNFDSDWLRMSIEAGGDPNIADDTGRTALYSALASGNLNNLALLLDAGANIDHQDVLGKTPVAYAAVVFDYDAVLFLLQHGACPHVRDNRGRDLRTTVQESVPADPAREATRQEVLKFLDQNAGGTC